MFWAAVEPLLPARERRFRYPGRKPIEDRAVLQGIIFVLVTGIPWKALPIELGFGSGQTCVIAGCASGPGRGCGRRCMPSC